jgi:hypothetical protein
MTQSKPDSLFLLMANDSVPQPIDAPPIRKFCQDTTIGLQSMTVTPAGPSPSPFRTHLLKPVHKAPVEYKSLQPDWVFGVFGLCLILLAWMTFFYRKRLMQVIYGTFSKRYLSAMSREGNLFKERISVSLAAIYILMFSMAIYQAAGIYLKWNFRGIPDILVYLILCAGTILFWVVKIVAMNFLSRIFKTGATNHAYLVNTMIFSSVTGLILLPALFFMVYLKSLPLLFLSFIILGLLFSVRFIKGLMIGFSLTKFSYLFLFVYLCALELLPLAVLLKLVISYFAIMM